MKLLLDQNLSYRLVAALHKEFPGSQHVRDVDLKDAADGDLETVALDTEGSFLLLE